MCDAWNSQNGSASLSRRDDRGGDTRVRDAKESGHRARFSDADEENLDQPQALPSVTSRRRLARETEREARARGARLTRVEGERRGGGWHFGGDRVAKPVRERGADI